MKFKNLLLSLIATFHHNNFASIFTNSTRSLMCSQCACCDYELGQIYFHIFICLMHGANSVHWTHSINASHVQFCKTVRVSCCPFGWQNLEYWFLFNFEIFYDNFLRLFFSSIFCRRLRDREKMPRQVHSMIAKR